jgi:hypothetical protein
MDQKNNITGIKHLIECHCILPQYRSRKDPVFHKFIVFSVVDSSDTCVPKFVQCNNCSAVHKVYDMCKSEIIVGKDELRSVTKIEEIKLGLNSDVKELLETYDCDIATWEMVKFVIENEQWGKTVVITQDTIDETIQGKALVVVSKDSFKIENFMRTDTI